MDRILFFAHFDVMPVKTYIHYYWSLVTHERVVKLENVWFLIQKNMNIPKARMYWTRLNKTDDDLTEIKFLFTYIIPCVLFYTFLSTSGEWV